MPFKMTKRGFEVTSKVDRNKFQIVLDVFLQLDKYSQYSKYGTYYVYNTFYRGKSILENGQDGLLKSYLIHKN